MASIHPLRALRYTPKAGEIASLATLPYDVIPPALESQYKARSPFNFAHLILPNGDYAAAAARLDEWKGQGILARDTEESLFVYQQTFPAPGSGEILVRRGFVGLGDTENYGKNVFRHERTLSGPKEDRFKLLQATQVQFDSIFMLFPDAEGSVDARLAEICATPAHLEYGDHEKTYHQLWRVTDPAWIAAIQLLMADKPVLIADGHHRYETGLAYRDERRQTKAGASGDPGYESILMFSAAVEDPGMVVFPTHRLVHGLPGYDGEAFRAGLARFFTLTPAPSEVGLAMRALSEAGQDGNAFLMVGRTGAWVLKLRADAPLDEVEVLPKHRAVRRLDVTVLHAIILEHLLGISKEAQATQQNLRYSKDNQEAFHSPQADSSVQVAFLMNSTKVDEVIEVADAGEIMPQKSTFFYPKIPSGLVLYPLD